MNITQGNGCAYNGNCTTGYCFQASGVCQSPCAIYENQGNYSNKCYCTNNAECSSQFCDGHTCKSIAPKDYGFFCNVHTDCGDIGICDHTMHECQPVCRIDGCYCSENDQCDSWLCKDWHCKSSMFVPTWTLTIGLITLLIIVILCVLYRALCKKKYVLVNRFTGYGYVEDASIKPPIFKEPSPSGAAGSNAVNAWK